LEFIEKAGHAKGLIEAMPQSHKDSIKEILINEALKTSEMENEYISREDVASSIKHNLGLHKYQKGIRDKRAKGIGQLITLVRNTFNLPLNGKILKKWHKHFFFKLNHISVGQRRSGKKPMQVVSERIDRPVVHFEAPPSSRVPKEIKSFISWFNETAPDRKNPIKHAPLRSAISHIYFESIHPFEGGNGQIGRAIADKALSQSIGFSLLLSLSSIIEKKSILSSFRTRAKK